MRTMEPTIVVEYILNTFFFSKVNASWKKQVMVVKKKVLIDICKWVMDPYMQIKLKENIKQ